MGEQSGAVEARWAHNPEVDGRSKVSANDILWAIEDDTSIREFIYQRIK